MFTAPVIILVLLTGVVPLLQAGYYSFTDWDGADAAWVGLQNYARFFSDPDFQRIALNSAAILLSVPIGMILPFLTAFALSSGAATSRLLRTLIFAPTALSWVVIGLVARSVFTNEGPANSLLTWLGLDALTMNWLADPTWALVLVILTFNASVFGVNTIIFLTGMTSLDRSLLEAARVDGANDFRLFVSIIIPLMRRFVEFVFVITVVLSFTGIFGLIYVMTAGGPGSATTTLEFAVFKIAFAQGDFGAAAAMGITLMAFTLAVLGVSRLISRTGDR
ncbi:carbohydrate ABC transporter permease [Occultella kanbiaonis]|uniref:carbohydrate ABC transporter permease n=1 Tax=Occultella kanbiaonis TaxID=2675754 RepID=UPI0013D5267E|nr:sugar ABC transporter permease [Occultella kanbiaonis]